MGDGDPKKHLLKSGKYPGMYYANSKYRQTGYDVVGSLKDRKGVYDKPDSINLRLLGIPELGIPKATRTNPRCKIGGKEHVRRYKFGERSAPGRRAAFEHHRVPYRNQAHHLVPKATFIQLFSDEERDILKEVKYDINNGRNIMFLPELWQDSYFHMLPYHHGSHGAYSDLVLADADKMRDKLAKYRAGEPCKERDDVAEDIADRLHQLQNDYWNVLKQAGPISISEATR